ncbi:MULTISPECIES: transposase [unclassified Mesorhizobium]|uniref:transposase n=1 Tax=unclassified Mesorhizobium TaxID=325217 RepID=UPI003014F021
MPDVKEAGEAVSTGQEKPKTAEKSPKATKPKTRAPNAARAKAAKPAKASATAAAAVATPVISASTRKRYSEKERGQKLGEIQNLIKAGESVRGATKKAGISEQTYYQWKKPTAKASQSDELKDLVKLESENARLKKLLAERLRKENADLKKKLGIS